MVGLERLRGSLRWSLLTAVFLIAAAGFIVFNIGEAHAVHSFEEMEAVVTVSDPVAHLIRAYKACRWAVFVVALIALLAYPAAMIPAKLLARRLYTVPGVASRVRARALRAGAVAVASLCVLGCIAGVVGIGANIKALDKVSEVQSRLQSGEALLDGSSATLSSLQAQGNSSVAAGLLSGVLAALSGGNAADNPLASLVTGANLSSLYSIISPMTVGNIVGALDASPQGLLQLVAFFNSKLAPGTTGLACKAGCLNEGDACICNVSELPELSQLSSDALSDIHLGLIGSCMIAIGCGLMVAAAVHCAASLGFNDRLVYGQKYDQLLAGKQGVLGPVHHDGLESQLPAKEVGSSGRVPIQAFSTEL